MKTIIIFFLLFLIIQSCEKANHQIETSTLIELDYPSDTGTSGEKELSVLGYGYDASGFNDTISVKAKVLNLHNKDWLYTGTPRTSTPNLIYVDNLALLDEKRPFIKTYLSSHINSIFNLIHTETPEKEANSYVYFSYDITHANYKYHLYPSSADIDAEITLQFKDDLELLKPEEIVDKYGTHTLISISIGTKLEIIYKALLNKPCENGANQGFKKRMEQFFGFIPGIISLPEDGDYKFLNEQLIYKSTGSKTKLFGLINATDKNPENHFIDINSVFGDNSDFQFKRIGEDGLIPLYELVSDIEKKNELQSYIESYLTK